MKKILVITGGPEVKIEKFSEASKNLDDVSVTLASFSDITFSTNKKFALMVKNIDVSHFDVIYIRMVGKRLEDATLLCRYAKSKGVKIVDRLYTRSHLMPESLGKSVELATLLENKIPVPKTYFGSLKNIKTNASDMLGFPFVLKSTTGRKAREVWSPQTKTELEELIDRLRISEKEGGRFFAQKMVKASQRIRVFILGGRAVAAFTRPTKWRKRFSKKEAIKAIIDPIPAELATLSEKAARTIGLDIAGVDILIDDKTHEKSIIEVNAAPSWNLISSNNKLDVEKEILLYLKKV